METATDRVDLPILLQHFARNVERHILCVDDPLDEAQVHRHELVAVGHDEDALDIQLHPDLGILVEQVERGVRRDEQQGLVFEGALGLHRDDL